MKRIIGLDVGGTKCAVVLAELEEGIRLQDKIAFPTRTGLGYEQARDRLFEGVEQILKQNGLTVGDIDAIGVSCGGPLDSKRGVILCPPNLPGWVDIPFVQLLEERFGVPAYLQNDAKACALVEWKLGAGVGTRNMMFLTMGTGMGSGIIAGGELVTGACDMGGEVGHIRLEEDGPVGFGKAGSFEGFCSGGGIARLAQATATQALEDGRPFAWGASPEAIAAVDTKALAGFAKEGDKDAVSLFAAVGEKLGKAVALFIDILNPEVVVIGSIFGRCEDLLRPAMEEVLGRECIPYSLQACRVVPAATGERIGDLASVMVAIHGGNIPWEAPREEEPAVAAHLADLVHRYPVLGERANDIRRAYALLREALESGGKVLCCGNGGSAADADHIVGELMKGFRLHRPVGGLRPAAGVGAEDAAYLQANLQGALPAVSLAGHTALSTAFANDVAPDMVFAQQVYGYGRPGDALVAISTSGNSPNVVRAAQVARLRGLRLIGLTGGGDSALSALCDVCIRVPGSCTAQVQELHLPVYHALCSMLEAGFFRE